MLRKLRFLPLCAVLLLGLLLRVRAEDAPPAPAPAPAPATPDVKPAAPAAEAEKKDTSTKTDDKTAPAAAPVAGALEPTVISGTPPTFPLKSDNFADIDEEQKPGSEAEFIEHDALEDILKAVRASSQEFLTKNVNPKINYVTMMNKPETCRGDVVKVSGTLRYVTDIDLKTPMAGVTKYWRGQISVGSEKIMTFISMEPLPKDLAIGRGTNVTGIFMKRWVYKNEAPGEQGTWTPLIVCRRVERVTDYDNVATGAMNSPVGIGIFVFVGAGILIYLWTRSTSKARYGNKFTRMKTERSNSGGRNFPRPG